MLCNFGFLMKKLFLIFFYILLPNGLCLAAEPKPWQINFQQPATSVMEDIVFLHHLVMYILLGVVFLVFITLFYICIRFKSSSNPIPMKFKDNLALEIGWTILPVIILITIAIPSFKILYRTEHIPASDMTVKVIGRQWYWTYQYPEHGEISFDSNLIPDDQLRKDQKRLLDVDNEAVIPVDTTVKFLVTSSDVIHSFTVPAFGRKIDAVPGRVNETWVNVKKTGTYYGQCSELCGVGHGFMPIKIKVVSKEEFIKWVEKAKLDFAYTSRNLAYQNK